MKPIQHRAGLIPRLFAITRLARRAYYPYRFQIVALVALSALAGVLEGIGINAVIPLMSYLVEAEGPATDTVTNIMRVVFQFLHLDFAPKYLLFFIVAMFVARGIVMFLVAYVQAVISSNYARATKSTLFESILRSSWSHLMQQRLGRLETTMMVDVPSSESLLRHLATTITLVTGIVVYLFVAFTVSPLITFITFALGFLVIFASKPFLYRIRMLGAERVRINMDTTHLVGEHILGMKTVKAAGVEDKIITRGYSLFTVFRDLHVKLALVQQATQFVIPPLGVLYIALIFGVAFKTSFISIAVLPAIFYLIYRIFLYVQQAQNSLQKVNELVPHLQNVLAYTDQSHEAEEHASGNAPFMFSKELAFKDVHYRYEDAAQDVLQGVSFSVRRGSLVGVIGPSGAGKTTCVDLLLRLLPPKEGAITLDGVDVSSISLTDWRKKTAYVSQDIFLLHDTIRNNIRFYNDAISDADIENAVRMAHLDDVVSASPDGLEQTVGERGLKFSAGQRQRIAIARALAHKPEILILDEATSALDAESESHIKRILEELKGKVTVITIAHRLSTIQHADKLVAIEAGKVVEEGTPSELLKNKGSYFYKVNSIT